jgi:NIMA (never in mitosis gene a)-related kinase
MAKGLKALHDINILHRDLKCANVFCTSDGKFKLGDLNVSKVAKRGMARTQTGTPYYTSPEVWNDKPYDSKCDIWSLGCVVYEMASLHPPFRASNLKELYAKIQRGLYESIPRFYSDDLKNIISLCLKVAASQRLSANELLTHPIILRNTPSS